MSSDTEPVFKVALRGEALLTSPRFNKGTAFTAQERRDFDLCGRLPFQVNTLDQQCQRAYDQFQAHNTDIRKNAFLQSLKAQNWVLYYTLVGRHLREIIPIIYTPTEADAIANYSHLFRRSEGLYLKFPEMDMMEEELLGQIKGRRIDLVVCSDAEAILGIGDQGVGGIGIATAKAAIYTLIGAFNPAHTLSVSLDVGTDNEDLLKDNLYVGWPHQRVRGEGYDKFIDNFVQLIRKHLPRALLHFEDFGVSNAQRLLELYRDVHPVFNDDIQGTGAVALSALMAAVGVTKSKLSEQRIIIYGAGSAGLGIARQLRDAMVHIDLLPLEKATKQFWLIDKHGLLTDALQSRRLVRHGLEEFAKSNQESNISNDDKEVHLLDVIKLAKPTVLIGTSTHAGGFTEEVIREMKSYCERPIIFPLSNPSRLVEVHPRDANNWTEGMALIATGSPFPPVKGPTGKDYEIAECNNALIYPGIGLGAVVSQAKSVTDSMIIAAARRLAQLSPALKDPDAALLPDFADSPEVNIEVAIALAEQAFNEGIARVDWAKEDVRKKVLEHKWDPTYGRYEYDPKGDS